MRAVTWTGFLNPDRKSGTYVHFLPATPGAATPYPVEVSVSVFGRGLPRKRISLEGARLFHPDGIKVEDIFALQEVDSENAVGFQLEIFAAQQRSDVSASQCLVQFGSEAGPVMFSPVKKLIKSDPQSGAILPDNTEQFAPINALKDAVLAPSLFIVNTTINEYRPEVFYKDLPQVDSSLVPLGQVMNSSVLERRLDGTIFGEPAARELSWGNVRSRMLSLRKTDNGVACFLVYRDVKTSRISSVHAL
jgi:hypothetical protein